MFEGKEALDKVDKLKNDLSKHNILRLGGDIGFQAEDVLNSGIEKKHVKKIAELEKKLDAVMRLLDIKEVPEEKQGAKLKKGKKEVDIDVYEHLSNNPAFEQREAAAAQREAAEGARRAGMSDQFNPELRWSLR